MVSTCFVFSLSDEKMYVERLYLNQVNALRTHQISLSAVAFLLQNLVVFSAPKKNPCLLVSDAICICLPPCVRY